MIGNLGKAARKSVKSAASKAKSKVKSGADTLGKATDPVSGYSGVRGELTESMITASGLGGLGVVGGYVAAGEAGEELGSEGGAITGTAKSWIRGEAREGLTNSTPNIRSREGGGVTGLVTGGFFAGGAAGWAAFSGIDAATKSTQLPFSTKGGGAVKRGLGMLGNTVYSGANSAKLPKSVGLTTGAFLGASLVNRGLSNLANKAAQVGTPSGAEQQDPRSRSKRSSTGSAVSERVAEYGGRSSSPTPSPSGSMVLDLHRSGGRGAVLR